MEFLRSADTQVCCGYARNNPANFTDPVGTWAKSVHHTMFDERFAGLPAVAAKWMKRGSDDVDAPVNQVTSGHSHEHKLLEGRMTQAEGEAKLYAFLSREASIAKEHFDEASNPHLSADTRESRLMRAYFHVGRFLHPIQDGTSPQHEGEGGGWGRWPSLLETFVSALVPGGGAALKEVLRHGDFFPSSRESSAFYTPARKAATDKAMDKAIGEFFKGYEKRFLSADPSTSSSR